MLPGVACMSRTANPALPTRGQELAETAGTSPLLPAQATPYVSARAEGRWSPRSPREAAMRSCSRLDILPG